MCEEPTLQESLYFSTFMLIQVSDCDVFLAGLCPRVLVQGAVCQMSPSPPQPTEPCELCPLRHMPHRSRLLTSSNGTGRASIRTCRCVASFLLTRALGWASSGEVVKGICGEAASADNSKVRVYGHLQGFPSCVQLRIPPVCQASFKLEI